MARITVIEYHEATGRLLEIYDEIIRKRGKLAEVHKIQSLRPESIIKHIDLYMEIMFSKSELSRADREMMAVIVSEANNCTYCCRHHTQALNHYWKDMARIDALLARPQQAGLNIYQEALCRYAKQLTVSPDRFKEAVEIGRLQEAGLSDSAILDATLVVAYFNFVNRIVLSLGVESDEKEVSDYVY